MKTESQRDKFTTFTIAVTLLLTISILLSLMPIWLRLPLSAVNYFATLPLVPFLFAGESSIWVILAFIGFLWIIVFQRSRVK